MPSVRSARSLTLLVATVVALGEVALGWADRLPFWLICPLAIATGGGVIAAALALDLLARRARRPDKEDIVAVRDLHQHSRATLDAHDERLSLIETRLCRVIAERDLAAAERELALTAERVERWDTLAQDLPLWHAAVERWNAVAVRLHADLASDTGPASDAELRSARALLPPARNFSSQDLKAAVGYFVQRERIVAAHDRLQAWRTEG